jgi:hypothetical protein
LAEADLKQAGLRSRRNSTHSYFRATDTRSIRPIRQLEDELPFPTRATTGKRTFHGT